MKDRIWKKLLCFVLVCWMMISMAFVTTIADSPDEYEYEEISPHGIYTKPREDD